MWNLYSSLFFILVALNFADACLKVRFLVCQCPQFQQIDQNGIRSMPQSAYMGDLDTYEAKISVNSDCLISVDVSMIPIQIFNLLMYRENAPPMIMLRFDTTTGKPSNATIPRLICDSDGTGTHKWWYRGFTNDVLIRETDLYTAIQSNEDSCGCGEIPKLENVNLPTYTNVNGVCDVVNMTCPGELEFIALVEKNAYNFHIRHPSIPFNWQLRGAQCVNKQWYYYGKPSNFSMECTTWHIQNWCQCIRLFTTSVGDNQILKEWYRLEDHQTSVEGIIVWEPIEYGWPVCAVQSLTCPEGKTPAFISHYSDPIMFTADTIPSVQCTAEFSAPTEQSDATWWINGVPVISPAFTCFD